MATNSEVVFEVINPDTSVPAIGVQRANFPGRGLFRKEMDLLQPPALQFWGSGVFQLPDFVSRQWVAEAYFTKQVPVPVGVGTPLGTPMVYRDYRATRWLEWRIDKGPIFRAADLAVHTTVKTGYSIEQKTEVESTLAVDMSATAFGLTAKVADTLKITTETDEKWTTETERKEDYVLTANIYYVFWHLWDIMTFDYADYYLSRDNQKHFFADEPSMARIDCKTEADIQDSATVVQRDAANAAGRKATFTVFV